MTTAKQAELHSAAVTPPREFISKIYSSYENFVYFHENYFRTISINENCFTMKIKQITNLWLIHCRTSG